MAAGRVALITGGASGIGLCCAKELLRNGLRAVSLADCNEDHGKRALGEIEKEFGKNKAIFLNTDVTDKKIITHAFDQTYNKFRNLDLLINSAGIMKDSLWEKEIQINIVATTFGTLLALDRLPKWTSTSSDTQPTVVNLSSIIGLDVAPMFPIYSATKFYVQALSRAFGNPAVSTETGVRVLTLCPGMTKTALAAGMDTLGEPFQGILKKTMATSPPAIQEPEDVAKGLMTVLKEGETGSVWVVEGGEVPYEVQFPTRVEMKNCK